MRRKLLGAEHPDIAASLHSLAELLRRDAATHKEAEQLYREALAMRRKLLGNEHPDVAFSLSGLGILLRNVPGRRAEAESCLREALSIRRKNLGNDHPEVAATLRNLGYLLKDGNPARRAEGEVLLREALAIQRKVLGDHRDTAMTLHFLASMVKDPKEQEALHREALALRRKVLRPGHADVAISLDRLADLLAKQGRQAEAIALYREEAARLKATGEGVDSSGEAALRIANQMIKSGRLLRQTGKRPAAEAAFRDALALRRNVHGNQHPDVADSLISLAMITIEQDRAAEAEALAREALAIVRKQPGGGDNLRRALTQLGNALYFQGRLAEAEAHYREILATSASASTILDPMPRLCDALIRLGKRAEAEPLVQLLLREAAKGGNMAVLNDIAWWLATALIQERGGATALRFAEQAVSTSGRTNAAYLETLAAAYAETGQFTNAVNAQKEAIALLKIKKQKEDYALRLNLYMSGVPYRDHGALATRARTLLEEGNFAQATCGPRMPGPPRDSDPRPLADLRRSQHVRWQSARAEEIRRGRAVAGLGL